MHPKGAKGFVDMPPTVEGQMNREDVRIDASGMATGSDNDAMDMARLGRKQECPFACKHAQDWGNQADHAQSDETLSHSQYSGWRRRRCLRGSL